VKCAYAVREELQCAIRPGAARTRGSTPPARRMVVFAHIPLFNPPIHIVAVRAIAGSEVLVHRN
jgi:hypothetical protein